MLLHCNTKIDKCRKTTVAFKSAWLIIICRRILHKEVYSSALDDFKLTKTVFATKMSLIHCK